MVRLAFVSAALAAATLAAAADHSGDGHLNLKRLDNDAELDHALEARSTKATTAKAKAAAAAAASKSKAASISKSKSLASKSKSLASKSKAAAAKSKSLASAASKSKSLASKSKSLASKASSLASKSASIASCAAASSESSARASASLASQASIASEQAASVSSFAASASSAAAAASSAQASLDQAISAFSQSQADTASAASDAAAAAASSLSAAQASISADAAAVASASSVEDGVSSSLAAASTSFIAAQASATASLASATSALAVASASAAASIADAQAAISTASAAAAQASADAASSASDLSSRSSVLDSVSSAFTAYAAQVTASFGSVSSALAASQSAIDSSASDLSITISSVSVVQSEISVSATQLATQSIYQASVASVASVQATATGIATACAVGKFLANGHCYESCPAQFPVEFARANTYGLCCTAGAKECLNADATAATVCENDKLFTVLDWNKLSGTCTDKCTTVDTEGTVYKYLQTNTAFGLCTKADYCYYGKETADAASGLCCASNVATCQDQTNTGATSCKASTFFTGLKNITDSATGKITATTGQCTTTCGASKFYSATTNACLDFCPVVGAQYTLSGSIPSSQSAKKCCADPKALSCSATKATTCVDSFALTSTGTCVAVGSCPNGAKDNGSVCCEDGALTCLTTTAGTTSTSCGLNAAGAQTYLSSANTCVVAASCPAGASVLDGGKGVCCGDAGSLTCDSGAAGHSLTCKTTSGYYLLPSTTGGAVGTCKLQCQGSYLDKSTNQCVAQCAISSAYYFTSTTSARTCCGTGATSCTAAGPTTCSVSGGYFLQPDALSCAKDCPSSSVKSSDGGNCCASGTITCSGVALHGDAIYCTSGFALLDGSCVNTCPTNTQLVKLGGGRDYCQCLGSNFAACNYDGTPKSCANGSHKSIDGTRCTFGNN